MSALGDRLRRRGVDPGSLLGWAQGAGYLDPLDRCSDRDLDGIVAEYRNSVGGQAEHESYRSHAVTGSPAKVLAEREASRLLLDAFLPSVVGGR